MTQTQNEWKYACPVMLTKDDLLQLAHLSGEMSIAEYAAAVLREHIQKQEHPDPEQSGYGCVPEK